MAASAVDAQLGDQPAQQRLGLLGLPFGDQRLELDGRVLAQLAVVRVPGRDGPGFTGTAGTNKLLDALARHERATLVVRTGKGAREGRIALKI